MRNGKHGGWTLAQQVHGILTGHVLAVLAEKKLTQVEFTSRVEDDQVYMKLSAIRKKRIKADGYVPLSFVVGGHKAELIPEIELLVLALQTEIYNGMIPDEVGEAENGSGSGGSDGKARGKAETVGTMAR